MFTINLLWQITLKWRIYAAFWELYDSSVDKTGEYNIIFLRRKRRILAQEEEKTMDSKKFGEFIAALRKEKGWTQAELAEKLSVTDKAVSRWERGVSHS